MKTSLNSEQILEVLNNFVPKNEATMTIDVINATRHIIKSNPNFTYEDVISFIRNEQSGKLGGRLGNMTQNLERLIIHLKNANRINKLKQK